jgi:hypothetical protein
MTIGNSRRAGQHWYCMIAFPTIRSEKRKIETAMTVCGTGADQEIPYQGFYAQITTSRSPLHPLPVPSCIHTAAQVAVRAKIFR